jgi:hypothetical protein
MKVKCVHFSGEGTPLVIDLCHSCAEKFWEKKGHVIFFITKRHTLHRQELCSRSHLTSLSWNRTNNSSMYFAVEVPLKYQIVVTVTRLESPPPHTSIHPHTLALRQSTCASDISTAVILLHRKAVTFHQGVPCELVQKFYWHSVTRVQF